MNIVHQELTVKLSILKKLNKKTDPLTRYILQGGVR